MARQRRSGNGKGTNNSSSSNGSHIVSNKAKTKTNFIAYWKHIIGFTCFAIAACVGYLGYLETRVNTPFDDKKVSTNYFLKKIYKYIFLDGCAKWLRNPRTLLGELQTWSLFRFKNTRSTFFSHRFNVVLPQAVKTRRRWN